MHIVDGKLAGAAAAALLACAAASPARAASWGEEEDREGVVIGFDVGPNWVVVDDEIDDTTAGIGFGGRIGYRLTADLLEVEPEVKLGFESPGTPDSFLATGGVRLGLGTIVSPVVFGHIGGLVGDLDGFVWDAGGGARVNIDAVSFGLSASYHQVEQQVLELQGPGGNFEVEAQWDWVQTQATLTFTL
jgi:hypothetical protein